MGVKRYNRGSTLVELMMVMTLLVLFGVTVFTLIFTGANTQERIMEDKNSQMDARIALSYVNVRLRQNDAFGKIAVEEIELTGKNAIVIRERTEDYEYDTWIFSYNGVLMECLVGSGMQPTEIDSFQIVGTEELDIVYNPEDGSITNTVYYYNGNLLTGISSTIYIRSHEKSVNRL